MHEELGQQLASPDMADVTDMPRCTSHGSQTCSADPALMACTLSKLLGGSPILSLPETYKPLSGNSTTPLSESISVLFGEMSEL